MTTLQLVSSNIFWIKDLSPSGMSCGKSGWANISSVRRGLPNHHPSTLFGMAWDIFYLICQDGAGLWHVLFHGKIEMAHPIGFESLLCLKSVLCYNILHMDVVLYTKSFLLSSLSIPFPRPKEPSIVPLPPVNVNLVTNTVEAGCPPFWLKLVYESDINS